MTAPTFVGYRVPQLIGVGATGPVYLGDDLQTHRQVAIKSLRTQRPPDVNRWIAEELNVLIDRLPSHPSVVTLREAGLENQEPYFVSDCAAGEPLDRALEHFGPGAISDVLPRLRAIADALDQAAAHGIQHGALHPPDVIVSGDSTVITGIGVAEILDEAGVTVPSRAPYVAPELMAGEFPSNASDQFSLAAIAFEWLFDEPISGPAMVRIDVPDLPGVHREALSDVFTKALARTSSDRFASCHAFVDGLSTCVSEAVEPVPVAVHLTDSPIEADEPAGTEPDVTLERGDRDPALPEDLEEVFAGSALALTGTRPVTGLKRFGLSLIATRLRRPPKRIGLALGAMLLIGMAWGVASSVVTIRRPLAEPVSASPVLLDRVANTEATGSAVPLPLIVSASAQSVVPSQNANAATDVITDRIPAKSVAVSGARAQASGENERRRTAAKAPQRDTRPASRAPSSAARRQATAPAATRAPARLRHAPAGTGNGSLLIESRPSGAAITINGMSRGKTPLRIGTIPAGNYEVTLRLPKFETLSVTVHVTAGEPARVGPSLTPLEPESKD